MHHKHLCTSQILESMFDLQNLVLCRPQRLLLAHMLALMEVLVKVAKVVKIVQIVNIVEIPVGIRIEIFTPHYKNLEFL